LLLLMQQLLRPLAPPPPFLLRDDEMRWQQLFTPPCRLKIRNRKTVMKSL
jgi:hypothetical protein